jgi:hypothetical protein
MPAIPGRGTAQITEWDLVRGAKADPGVQMTVDFDPQSLELSYQVAGPPVGQQPETSGTQANKAPAQQTSQTSTLSFTLVFDSTDTGASVQDKTEQLVTLTKPVAPAGGQQVTTPRKVVQFSWGTFLYFGSIQSLSQTIDYFSSSGVPLRATVHLTLAQVDPPAPPTPPPSGSSPTGLGFGAGVGIGASASLGISASAGLSVGAAVGTTPLTLSAAGDSLQAITARAGGGVSWKAVAAANNIDNPRLLPPGTVLDLNAGAQLAAGVTAGASAGAGVSAGASASAGADVSAGASASASAGGSAGAGV